MLPSNSSMDIHPENTVATFQMALPRHLELEGQYEVALMEIHYPSTMITVDSKDCIIMEKSIIDNVVIRKFLLTKSTYVTIEQLLHIFNNNNVKGTYRAVSE
jgi:Tfp pilus assembly PilM family ATPase